MVQVTKIPHFEDLLVFGLYHHPGKDAGVQCYAMRANPMYLWFKHECFLISGCQDMNF